MVELNIGEENMKSSVSIPNWIKEDFFKPILKKDFPEFKNLTAFIVKPAIAPGENYLSMMYRISMDIELKNCNQVKASYILKTTLDGSEASDIISSMNVFPKESEMYEKVIPKLEKLYSDVGEDVHFAPQAKFFENSHERTTIVMEDLKTKRFQNFDRSLGLDLRHMEEVLKKLAQFHAASMVHHERYGPFSAHFCQSFYNEKNRDFFIKRGRVKVEMYKEALKKWGDCEKYIDLWHSSDSIITWSIENDQKDPEELTVLNHGDCWTNNVMFQYNENGDIKETLLVDFQVCKWGVPAQDFYYLITTSADYNIRVREFDKFVRIYQENLAKNLKILKYSKCIPTLKDIHIHMIKNSLFSFFAATSTLGIILLEPSENITLYNLLKDVEFQKAMLMNPRFVKTLKQLLPWWENRGVFEL